MDKSYKILYFTTMYLLLVSALISLITGEDVSNYVLLMGILTIMHRLRP